MCRPHHAMDQAATFGTTLALVTLIACMGHAAGDLVWCNSVNRQSLFGSLAPKQFKFVKNASEYSYDKSSASSDSPNWCISVVFFGASASGSNVPDASTTFLALLGTPHDGFGPGKDNVTLDLPSSVSSADTCVTALKPALDSYATQFKTLYPSQWGQGAAVSYTVQCCQNGNGQGLLTDACNWLIPPLAQPAQPGAASMLHAPMALTLLSMILSFVLRNSLW